jgi:amino acid permease
MIRELLSGSKDRLVMAIAFFQAFVAANTDLEPPTGPVSRARNAGTVISVVVIGLVALVGIMIFGEVSSAMPSTNTTLDTVSDNIVSGFGDAMGLVPIILLVLLASVVIAVVQRMRA